MPAADVGDLGTALQLLLDAVERRDPLGDEVRLVARAEEALGAAEQAMVVLVPAHAAAAAEGLEDLVLIGVQRSDRVVYAEDVERALFVGERERVLVGQRVAVAVGVVGDVATSGLVAQPLAHGSLGDAGALGELFGGERAGSGHRPVQAELLPDDHQRCADDGAHIGDRLAHEGFELRLVDVCSAHV